MYIQTGHSRSATEINVPCNDKVLCKACSQNYRQQNGPTCSLCNQPSTISETATKIECAACYEEFDTGLTVRSSDTCNHHLCIGCMTQKVRLSLNERQNEFDSPNSLPGICCPGDANCQARVGISRINIVKRVSEAHLPHALILGPEAQTPLTDVELAKYDRFSKEGKKSK